MSDASTSSIDFSMTEQQTMVRDLARDFAENEIRSVIMQFDESQEFPMEIFKKMGELGFLGIIFPEKYGGAGFGYLEYATIVEELSRVDPSVGLGVAAHNGLCTNHIYLFGSEENKLKYLPNLTTGKIIGMWGLTEPGSGSDAGALKTTAVRNGNEWVINGSKNFITHGTVGETAVILAATNKETGTRGISAFVTDRFVKGFSTSKKENKLGMRCSDTSSLSFVDMRIPHDQMLGKEGDGFKQALKILDGGRISIAANALGLAQGAYESTLKYSKERQQFGKPLCEFQDVQFKLAKMATEIEAARLMTYKSAWLKDHGQNVNIIAAQAKYYASEVAVRVTNEAVQIHGGYGFTKDYPVEKFYRDVKLTTIGEGTSEIQKLVIARGLLDLH